jgi:putative tricarboxylic transport membrane protein
MTTSAKPPPRESNSIPALIAAAVVSALGMIVIVNSLSLHRGSGFTAIQPALFPQIVGAALLVAAALLVIEGRRGIGVTLECAAPHWGRLMASLAALTVFAFSVKLIGFPLAVAAMMPLIARLSGSNRLVRDTIVGLVLGTAVYFVIGKLLGVDIPGGPVERLTAN